MYSNHHLNTRHLNTGQVKAHYLDVSSIQMFVIQIPTVGKFLTGEGYGTTCPSAVVNQHCHPIVP